jgi:EEF1A lysine methyltransferase 4
MPPRAPSFGSQQYWNDRFVSNSNPFEWLEAPTALDPFLTEALQSSDTGNPHLLHIGCGTSLLSYHLRKFVDDPQSIHNLDYSDVAVDIGKKREIDIYKSSGKRKESGEGEGDSAVLDDEDTLPLYPTSEEAQRTRYMRWSAADLLDHTSLLEVCKPAEYSVILDKSTSDSIACTSDVYVSQPYAVSIARASQMSQISKPSEPVLALRVLAVHLAILAKPKARWISISYSEDRYPFLQYPPSADSISGEGQRSILTEVNEDEGTESSGTGLYQSLGHIPQLEIHGGLPDPGILWKVVRKDEIEAPSQGPRSGAGTTHRPKVVHWVYILERTDIPVFVRDR